MPRYSGANVGGICSVRIYTFDQIASMSDPINNIVALVLASGVSADPLPVTPETAAPDIESADTDGGDLWTIKFPLEIPKIDSTSRASVESYRERNVVVVYELNTGLQFILGTADMPMRCTKVRPNQPASPGEATSYYILIEGVALDEPYQCTVSTT